MSRVKTEEKKKALGRLLRQNRRVPIFVMARTRRRVTRNVKSRNWRSRKLDLKVD
ncbi:MAG: 50S ribosomal protein L39e [Candidatus Micrarchaeia archaeon]